jgi:hypothetical protein
MDDAAALMRDAFRTRQYWLFVADNAGRPLVERCIDQHYNETGADDVRCIVLPYLGRMFAIIGLKKEFMSGKQLQRHLQGVGIYLSRREVAEKDVFIATESAWINAASLLTDRMMSDPAAPKVRAAPARSQWYGCPN